jgi:hypothetical protein
MMIAEGSRRSLFDCAAMEFRVLQAMFMSQFVCQEAVPAAVLGAYTTINPSSECVVHHLCHPL